MVIEQKNIKEHLSGLANLDDDTAFYESRIVLHLRSVGASFVSEMAWELSVTEYQIKLVLKSLIMKGLVEQLRVDPHDPEVRLLRRVADQSHRGQGGYENFAKKKWFGLTKKGYEVRFDD